MTWQPWGSPRPVVYALPMQAAIPRAASRPEPSWTLFKPSTAQHLDGNAATQAGDRVVVYVRLFAHSPMMLASTRLGLRPWNCPQKICSQVRKSSRPSVTGTPRTQRLPITRLDSPFCRDTLLVWAARPRKRQLTSRSLSSHRGNQIELRAGIIVGLAEGSVR